MHYFIASSRRLLSRFGQARLPFAARLAAVAVVLALLGAGALAYGIFETNPAGAPVGLRMLRFGYAGLPRPINGAAWYPAAAGSRQRAVWYSSAVWGHAAQNAPIAKGSKRPLIVLAHGWSGTRFDLSWVGEALAREGYVVASLDMPEVDAKTFDDAQAPKVWYRASLLRALIDAVAADPLLAANTDTDHVIAIGHSAGGSAAFMLGGAELDPVRFSALFPLSAPVVSGTWSDPRLVGIVALNPGTGPAFAPAGLRSVRVPALILSGTGDDVAPEATNAGYYAQYVPHTTWLRLPQANHYSFMPECSPWGLLRGFSTCKENTPSVVRADVHERSLNAISQFVATLAKATRR